MRQLLGTLFLVGGLVACQQTQEADDEPDTTVIEEEEIVVPPPADEPDVELDVKMEGDEGGASGEVKVEGN